MNRRRKLCDLLDLEKVGYHLKSLAGKIANGGT